MTSRQSRSSAVPTFAIWDSGFGSNSRTAFSSPARSPGPKPVAYPKGRGPGRPSARCGIVAPGGDTYGSCRGRALVAAGAALIGVAVNYRQVKAAIRNAEATYRAAVDSAREQGLNEHRQWRRTMRREAYATLLQTVLSFNDHAEKVLTQGWQDARLLRGHGCARRAGP